MFLRDFLRGDGPSGMLGRAWAMADCWASHSALFLLCNFADTVLLSSDILASFFLLITGTLADGSDDLRCLLVGGAGAAVKATAFFLPFSFGSSCCSSLSLLSVFSVCACTLAASTSTSSSSFCFPFPLSSLILNGAMVGEAEAEAEATVAAMLDLEVEVEKRGGGRRSSTPSPAASSAASASTSRMLLILPLVVLLL